MRQWTVDNSPARLGAVLADAIDFIGDPIFDKRLLERVHSVLPAASCSVYQTGSACVPTLFLSASHGVPDTTVDCWRAYLSGPYRTDSSLAHEQLAPRVSILLSHISAREMPAEHRAKVYEAHGVAERVSVVEVREGGLLFAINFYRHQHQRPFLDAQISDLTHLALPLLALTRKHLALRNPHLHTNKRPGTLPAREQQAAFFDRQLREVCPGLTSREREVCVGLLQGLTADGVACALGISTPTVKTYRNRAFDKMGIRFRNQLFALVLRSASASQAGATPRH